MTSRQFKKLLVSDEDIKRGLTCRDCPAAVRCGNNMLLCQIWNDYTSPNDYACSDFGLDNKINGLKSLYKQIKRLRKKSK